MVTKAHILQEIKRLTDENGGVSPGERKFKSDTGITRSDWEKYWPSGHWTEPQCEAGCNPNTRNVGNDEEQLLDKLAQLARKKRQIPDSGDIRGEKSTDSTFPWPQTFNKRLGKKMVRVQKLLEYCRKHGGYSDVILLCEQYQPLSRRELSDEGVPQGSDSQDGFVYLMKSGRFHKIGRSNSAGRREYELAIQLPEKAKRIHVIRTDDPGGIEAYWHKRFEAKRKNGEWFELDANDIAAFKRRKFQ
jgi:hypothetical protein